MSKITRKRAVLYDKIKFNDNRKVGDTDDETVIYTKLQLQVAKMQTYIML